MEPNCWAAEGTTAGNAVMVPGVIASANASFATIAPIATVQVAASAVTTAILIPIVLTILVKYTNIETTDGKKKKQTSLESIPDTARKEDLGL